MDDYILYYILYCINIYIYVTWGINGLFLVDFLFCGSPIGG